MRHVMNGQNTVCCLCGNHKDCPLCMMQNPTCPDADDGKHIWQDIRITASDYGLDKWEDEGGNGTT